MSAFPRLPDISFVDTDPAVLQAAVIAGYEKITRRTLYPGNPERLFLEALAYTLAMQNLAIDAAGKKNLLAYADGPHLDHIGVQHDTPRLDDTRAVTVLRFTLPGPLGWKVDIPGGTRIGTADKSAVFATDEYAAIEPGHLTVDVRATATVSGAACNGLVPGQINTPIDPPLYYTEVRNIVPSMDGADVEKDPAYRLRIHESREAYTSAGPRGSYHYHARRVHPDIADVSVWTPVPGTVDIRPIMVGGELPSANILRAIEAALSAEDVRPLTDTVVVKAPVPVEYALAGGWYLSRKDAALAGSVSASVARAVEEYRLWQRSMPGRDINPDHLQNLIKSAGAKRMRIDSPAFQPLEPWQIARETSLNFIYMGLEDE